MGGEYSHIFSIWGRSARQGIIFRVLRLKRGIQFHKGPGSPLASHIRGGINFKRTCAFVIFVPVPLHSTPNMLRPNLF